MATAIGTLLIAVAVLAVIGYLIALTVSMMREGEYGIALMPSIAGLIIIGLLLLQYGTDQKEKANPCIAWGPPETHWQLVGKIMTPVTVTPCVQRQNTVEK